MKRWTLIILTLFGFFHANAIGAEKIAIIADEWPQMDLLAEKLLGQAGYEIDKFVQEKCPADLSGYYAAFSFIHGNMSAKAADALMKFARNGGRLIVLHHGISSKKRNTPGWLPFLGIYLAPNDDKAAPYSWTEDVDYLLVNLQPHHYISSHNVKYDKTVSYQSSDFPSQSIDAPALEIPDSEVYFNHQFIDGREKTVLFGFLYEDKNGIKTMQDRGGWYKPVEKGWVFYFKPGHSVKDIENPNYFQIIWNCLTWKP
ncbi:MAG: ThuA domain-containing protein [Candidatus Omnitrophota bacterium]